MRQADFRRIALRLPQTSEGSHMGHADFRVAGRVFATLGYPAEGWAMVKLTPEQQTVLVESEPGAFTPVSGGWGRPRHPCTHCPSDRKTLNSALALAWRNVAPKSLILDRKAILFRPFGGCARSPPRRASGRRGLDVSWHALAQGGP